MFLFLMFMEGIFFGLIIDMMSEKMQLGFDWYFFLVQKMRKLCVYLFCFFRYSTGCGE